MVTSPLERILSWGSGFDAFVVSSHGVQEDGTWWALLRAEEIGIMAYQRPPDPRIEFVLGLTLEPPLARDPRLLELLQELEERRPALFWHRVGEDGEVEIRWRIWEDGLTRHSCNVAVNELAEAHGILGQALDRLRSQRRSEFSLLEAVRGMSSEGAVPATPEPDVATWGQAAPLPAPFADVAEAAPEAPGCHPFADASSGAGFLEGLSTTQIVRPETADELRRQLFGLAAPGASSPSPGPVCSSCARLLTPESRFCNVCGTRVSD